MSLLYTVAGINHFIHPEFYQKIMPPWLPGHELIIIISGILEIFLGLLLLKSDARNGAAWGIIVLLIIIFPANIQMLFNYISQKHPNLWVAILRLPLQLVLIWWAYTFTADHKRKINRKEDLLSV